MSGPLCIFILYIERRPPTLFRSNLLIFKYNLYIQKIYIKISSIFIETVQVVLQNRLLVGFEDLTPHTIFLFLQIIL